VLADFGFTAPKKRVLTPDEKAAAAVKAKATRKARNTMGKVQKKSVKGTTPAAAPLGGCDSRLENRCEGSKPAVRDNLGTHVVQMHAV
jgi:hypothetical protein